MAIIAIIKRLTSDVAVRIFSNEKDRTVYAVPAEQTQSLRSLFVFGRKADGKAKQTVAADVIRVRDFTVYPGTAQERIASASIKVTVSFPKGMSNTDMTAMVDDIVGALQHAETRALCLNGYLPN